MAGRLDVDAAMREIPAPLFNEWRAYDEMSPIGGRRGDWQAASVVAALYNLHRNRELYPDPFAPGLFVLEYGGERAPVPQPRRKTWQELKSIVQAYVLGTGEKHGRRP